MGRPFIKTARFRKLMAEREEQRSQQREKLGLPPLEEPTAKVSKKKSKVEKEAGPVKRAPRKEVLWLTNSREGKTQEWIEAIEKLERQAVKNRLLIDFPEKKKNAATSKEEGGLKKIGRKFIKQTYTANDTNLEIVHYYPRTPEERKDFVNPVTGKCITDFQYRVYDLLAQVPRGQVTSYKVLSDVLKSNPIAIGGVSHNNPFWPLPIPCHRLICTDGFIGGPLPTDNTDSQFIANKKAKLILEGITFDDRYNFVKNALGTKDMFTDFIL